MEKSNSSSKDYDKALPEHIAEMPARQREEMQKARKKGEFDGKDHLAKSPIGRAVASGFPLKRR
ncbi:MAG: hypothetical protein K6L80_09780 [Agarilytica sp.]